jgi:hypothetical protein
MTGDLQAARERFSTRLRRLAGVLQVCTLPGSSGSSFPASGWIASMSKLEWQIDEKGGLKVSPLLRWGTGHAYDSLCVVRLEYATSPETMGAGGESVQLIMPPKMALALSEQLRELAERVLAPGKQATPQ